MLNDREALERWIAELVASAVDLEPAAIDVEARLDRYGIDSAAAIGLTDELEQRLGVPLDPTLLYEYPTIRRLSGFLTGAP
ncbi:MAG TPA: acyl carrier protein [Kofleriaceae bacterium]|nr:acyl carrier protein [Kofleriaceae bacterium]